MRRDERDPFVERLLEGGQPPPPPAALRPKVLAAARASLAEGASGDRWSKIWEHRGLRLGWTAAVVMLLIGHLLVTPRHSFVYGPSYPELFAGQRADPEVIELLRPAQISENVQPIFGLIAVAGVPVDLEMEGNDS